MSDYKSPLKLIESKRIFENAKKVVPGGLMGIRNPKYYVENEYPMYIDRGYNGHLVDVDGNDYIDMLCGYGPIILGYNDGEIKQAVIEQIEKGFCFTLCQEIQMKLAKKLTEIIPSSEMNVFTKTGSDANSIAIRVARAYTGRKKILRCGYHGWHDWCTGPDNGIPKEIRELVIGFPYGDLDTLESLLEKNREDIAGIIMTPIEHDRYQFVIEPKDGYLKGVRELANKYNVVLIFDEIRTGFRMALGGAQELYNVIPDLTTMGKAMANGYAISVCTGKKEIMEVTQNNMLISSTFFPNSLEMVAALKCIEIIERDNVIENIWVKGKFFASTIKDIANNLKAPVYSAGIPPMPYILFDKNHKHYEILNKSFYTEMIRRKVLLTSYHHWYIANSHTQEDMEYMLNAIADSLEIVKQYF